MNVDKTALQFGKEVNMSKDNRITCPYHNPQYDAFHDICPLNGEVECEHYMVIESHMPDVDQAFGEYQRGAYHRPEHQKRVTCPYHKPQYDSFHDICPKNGTVECEGYQLLERRLEDVDMAFGEFQRGAYHK